MHDKVTDNTTIDPGAANAQDHQVSAQQRGETMAYAAQNLFFNGIGNFIESAINHRIQCAVAGWDPKNPKPHGDYTQNTVGEFIGDGAGAVTLIALEAFCPEQYHDFSRKARSWVDPFYDKLARLTIKKDCPDNEYEAKVNEWKVFQERNLIRAGVVGTVGIAANIFSQKVLLNNKSPTSVIFAGKAVSTSLMLLTGLTARYAFPKQLQAIDEKIGTVLAPMIDDDAVPAKAADGQPASHVEALSAKRSQTAELEPQASR
jgi:hypothetical protein